MSVAEEEKQLVREKPKSKRFAFVLLGIAIVAEVTGAICLKASEGLTVPLPTLITVIGYLITFTLLIKILQNLPLGLVYGIWGGVGSAVTMLVGVVVWHDPFTAFTAVGVLLVIGGVYLLNKGTDEIEVARAQQQLVGGIYTLALSGSFWCSVHSDRVSSELLNDSPSCELKLPLPGFILRDMDASFTIGNTDSMQGCLRRVQIALAWLRGHSA